MSREVESVTNYLLQNRIRGIGVVEPQYVLRNHREATRAAASSKPQQG